MAKEFGRWFRFYDGVLDDPKIQRLPLELRWAWVEMLCLASRNDGHISGDLEVLSFSLRRPSDKVFALISKLVTAGLIDKVDSGGYVPHNWDGRQFKSDLGDVTAAERQRRKRDRDKIPSVTTVTSERDESGLRRDTIVTVTDDVTDVSRVTERDSHGDVTAGHGVTVTPTRTETDTEQSQSRDSEAKASAVAVAPAAPRPLSKQNLQKLSFDLGDSLGIARPAVGSMAKKCGYDWTAVHEVLSRCKANSPVDPTSWCMAEFTPLMPPERGPTKLAQALKAANIGQN